MKKRALSGLLKLDGPLLSILYLLHSLLHLPDRFSHPVRKYNIQK